MIKKYLALLIVLFYAFTGVLLAKSYDKTSYYIAYNKDDNNQYVLVMPSVSMIFQQF